ncbi:SDR family oxidoreductase [Brachybacterium sp. DNPG3]
MHPMRSISSTRPLPRTALITGVGRRRGIAAAIAAGLAADGFDLALSFHDAYDQRVNGEPSDVEELAAELRGLGARVVLLPGDLADPTVPGRLVGRAEEELGRLGALVMSHCESVDSSLLDTSVESFDRHYAVNVRASWLLLKAFAEQVPLLTPTPSAEPTGTPANPSAEPSPEPAPADAPAGGAVIALTSDHTVHNLPYGATKGALDRLVLAGTHELADRGIRTNVINPGPIDTGWMDEATHAACAAQTPGRELGGTGTVADLVRFLLSERGAWIRGQRLHSDGGFSSPAL